MRVTVCELSNDEADFRTDWSKLIEYLDKNPADLLLLPEMPFCEWIAYRSETDESLKKYAVARHEQFVGTFESLNTARIVYSRPVLKNGLFHNTAYIWDRENGERKIHTKQYFPEEPHFYEATWFDADDNDFQLVEVGGVKIGVLLCTEMWFTEHARKYGTEGIDLLLCPRATGKSSVDQWVRCGQTLAVISGAYCLSANRCGKGKDGFQWGGASWIAQPGNGELLGVTSDRQPFVTIGIDLQKARDAKIEYPLYVKA
ncbi:MAG: carbon-nitrogen hydrolase family protein [Cyclobacteriaceae bacterium]